MFEENKEVVVSADTTTDDLEDKEQEDESTGEDEVEEKAESGKQHSTESPEARRARIKRQYEREFGKPGKESDKEGSKESGEVGDDRYTRLELKTEGITSKKAQDVVLDYAKFKGIDALEALKSPIVRAEIAELEKKTSAPPPSKRTNAGATDSFEYWAAQARKGNWPRHDRAMMDKLKKARVFTS